MISRILILAPGGLLFYSKNFLIEEPMPNSIATDDDLIGGFLTAISSFAKEIKSGEVRALNFRNVNFIYSHDTQYGCIFILIADIFDLEEEVRERLELMKEEFIKRYSSYLENFNGRVSQFQEFDEFVEENIFIPPKILLIGENGVGKTTIMDLFPGETILEIDEDTIEVIEKYVGVSGIGNLKQFLIREVNLEDVVNNSKLYKPLLNSTDIICMVTNSAASNLSRTKRLFSQLQPLVKNTDLFLIANFQDLKDTSFEPKKIEESFSIKTYGLSAINEDAQKDILLIFKEILNTSIVEKIK